MSQKPKRKNYRAAYKIRVTQPDIDQSTQLLFKQLMEKSHAFKAAEALDDLSVAALSAANVSFYELPSSKTSYVEENIEEDNIALNTNSLENRIAHLETTLTDIANENNEAFASLRAVQGELKVTRNESLAHEKTLQEHVKLHVRQNETIELQKEQINTLEERLNVLEQRSTETDLNFQRIEKEIDARVTELRNGVNTLGTEIEKDIDGLEKKSRQTNLEIEKNLSIRIEESMKTMMLGLTQVRTTTEKALKATTERTEESLETLANDLLIYVDEFSRKTEVESTSYRERAQQRLEALWKDLRDSMREAFVNERRRSDGIAERLSRMSIDGSATFESQILKTVQTITSIKESMERSMEVISVTVRRGGEERSEMQQQLFNVNQITKTVRETSRLAEDAKENVRKLERKVSRLSGQVSTSRENTLEALSHLRKSHYSPSSRHLEKSL